MQFTDDRALQPAFRAADEVVLDDVSIRVIRAVDLLHEKLRAGRDPERRRTERLQDLLDAQKLIEDQPQLADALTAEERALLDTLPS